MREALWLARNGIPLRIALGMTEAEFADFALDDVDRLAWTVITGEHEGGKFNWRSGAWEERKP